jgi:hypothetical protein
MRSRRDFLWVLVVGIAVLAMPMLRAGASPPKKEKQGPTTRLSVEVTSDKNEPVVGASVYVRWYVNRKTQTGKTDEMNLKTNEEGVARSPDVPQGKILVQIIAPGWKTFGQWYDVEQDEQTIPIALVRPDTKWY